MSNHRSGSPVDPETAGRLFAAELRWGLIGQRHMPGKHNQKNHSDGTGAVAKAVTKAATKSGHPSATIRNPNGGTMTVTASPGRVAVRIPRHYEVEDGVDTVDVPADAEMAADLDDLAETVRLYQAKIRQAIKKMDAAEPGSDAYKKAQDEFFALSGDGQRVAAGGRPGDDGAELHWDVIFEEEDQPIYRFAVRPPDADDAWDIAYAVDTPDGGIALDAAGFRKFRAQVEAASRHGDTPTVKVRTQAGSVQLSRNGGRLSIQMPTPDFDDDLLDTVTLDASTAADFAEELQIVEEAGAAYNARVRKLWNAAVAINPDGGGDDDTDPKSKAAWAAVAELAGDGQRITGGQLDTADGAELHYELWMGDEPDDMDLLIAIRPPDAPDDWDLFVAAGDEAGAFLSWSQFRKLRREVDKLLATS